jgi:WhiB family transcriptional regulator, redox-sensing transcriptional regulator
MKTAEDNVIRAAERWRVLAACRTAEPELFFPISAQGPSVTDAARAKRICASCPVRSQCLDYARATHQTYGIWGGLTEQERRA